MILKLSTGGSHIHGRMARQSFKYQCRIHSLTVFCSMAFIQQQGSHNLYFRFIIAEELDLVGPYVVPKS